MKVKTAYDEYTITRLEIGKYSYGNNLAIELICFNEDWETEEPFATITVNLNYGIPLKENEAFIDVNNCPWAIDFIKSNKLGEYMGIECPSGYCKYPLYSFDLDKLRRLK